MTYTRPPEDRHSSTVDGAEAHERWRGQEAGEDQDDRPTLAEARADEAWLAGEWGAR